MLAGFSRPTGALPHHQLAQSALYCGAFCPSTAVHARRRRQNTSPCRPGHITPSLPAQPTCEFQPFDRRPPPANDSRPALGSCRAAFASFLPRLRP